MTATEQWIFLCAAHKTPKEVSWQIQLCIKVYELCCRKCFLLCGNTVFNLTTVDVFTVQEVRVSSYLNVIVNVSQSLLTWLK